MKYTVWNQKFSDRERMDESKVARLFCSEVTLDQDDVAKALQLISRECEIPVGQLRPSDRFDEIFKRLPTRNPLRWWLMETNIWGREDSLEFELSRKRKSRGAAPRTAPIETIAEYVDSWCGN